MASGSDAEPGRTGKVGPAAADAERVAAVRAGDLDAFEALFREYYRPLLRFAETLVGSQDAAEDLVEDLFVRLWERRRDWHLHGRLTSYLHQAVRNASLNHLHRERRSAQLRTGTAAAGSETAISPFRRPDEDLEDARIEAAVRAAVEALPERAREAFVLHRYHGKTQSEIAGIMGVSPRTVENHVARAVRLLRDALASWR